MPRKIKNEKIQPLTIEKFVKLLSDFHLAEFKGFLQETNALLPLKLVKSIDRDPDSFQGGDMLCRLVYGKDDSRSKLNFNQLASYTFRMAGWVAKNYPSFLSHNIELMEVLVNTGRLEKANILAENLLDIAEKIEDFRTQTAVLAFLSQQNYLHYNFGESLRLHSRLVEVLETNKVYNEVQVYFKTHFNITARRTNMLEKLDEHLAYFNNFINHPSFAISSYARYCILFIKYYFTPSEFFSPETQQYLLDFESDLNKYGYVTMPFLTEIRTRLSLFKLNFPDYNYGEKEGKKELERLLSYSHYYKFWKYFANLPELYATNIKGTYYLSKYHTMLHRPGFERIIEPEDKKDIASWQERSKYLLDNTNWGKEHLNDMIHLRLNYAALLLLGSNEMRKTAVMLVEETLITYQQLSFSESLDSFISCLMIGYFSLGDYDKCASTFIRYIKLNNNKIINQDNDWVIYSYYYTAQWIQNRRKQYPKKLWDLYDSIPNEPIYRPNKELIEQLADDFGVRRRPSVVA
ncbi:MAG: hypothetical protein K1X82_05965 [Bacteroidia bacterium]|nr:hypothetical protein [Bacteroidia bacterium]